MKRWLTRAARNAPPPPYIHDSSAEEDFECDFYKPDICDPSHLPCSQNEICVDSHGSPSGMRHSCFVTWTNDTTDGVKVKFKGCWLAQDVAPYNCANSECVADSAAALTPGGSTDGPSVYWCCCNTSKCNEKFLYRPSTSTIGPNPTAGPPQSNSNASDVTASLVYAFAPICLLALLIIVFYWIYRRYKLRRTVKRIAKNGSNSTSSLPFKSPPSPTDGSKSIELIEVVSKGRYGAVWKARVASSSDQFVAVKVFPAQDSESWMREQEIYNTPGMKNHANILQYLGSESRPSQNGPIEYWLVTAYQEFGSLHDYLKKRTLTLPELLQILTSMMGGLAYLHEESPLTSSSSSGSVDQQQIFKPTIVHRDFKSRNVLLKNDLTACVADFGLALKCPQGRLQDDVHAQVGTRRYMAPEVLQGAMEFSAFGFRQIDVYAAALVVWETVSRCSFEGEKIDDHRLPFEEAGTKPSLEQLQNHVITQKQRPPIKKEWRSHSYGAVVCSSMEEMWDMEPEARVTAGCAYERFSALQLQLHNAAVPLPTATSTLLAPSTKLSPSPSPSSMESGISSTADSASERLETSPLIFDETPRYIQTPLA